MRYRDIGFNCITVICVSTGIAYGQFREIKSPDSTASSTREAPTATDEAKSILEPAIPEPKILKPAAEEDSESTAVAEPGPVDPIPTPAEPAGKDSGPPSRSHPWGLSDKKSSKICPIQFNRVNPGKTTTDEVIERWGEPAKQISRDETRVMAYKVAQFKQVDVISEESVVTGVLVHLNQPLPINHLALELSLTGIDPVLIPDEVGNVLGQAYPERGVMFHYAVDQDDDVVSEILLEPIRGELFRLRAEYDFEWKYSENVRDLQVAIDLSPGDDRAHWLLARRLIALGQYSDALKHVETAESLNPSDDYTITRARILAFNGSVNDATNLLEGITEKETSTTLQKAEAYSLAGTLAGLGPSPDYQKALDQHLKAIKLAIDSAGAQQFDVRRQAKRVLAEAHLGTARDIAGGYFQRQSEVVPKWLERGHRLVKEFVERDQGDPSLVVQAHRATLDAYALLPHDFDPAVAIDEALTYGRQLIADHTDERFQESVEHELTHTLFQAAEIERARGQSETSLKYANNAIALFENSAGDRESTPRDRIFEGQLYFLIGALHAVHHEDHTEAAKWFDKAEPLLREPMSPSRYSEYGLRGERFVSMGVSFWETQQQKRAVDSTMHGVTLIKQGVTNGSTEEDSLSVPYGNLATMHQNLGNTESARRFAGMMNRNEKR